MTNQPPVNRVKAQRSSGPPAIVAMFGVALCVVAAACGQSTSAVQAPTPVAVATSAVSAPPGGPVPAALVGDWFQPSSVAKDFDGNAVCVLLKLTLTATTYKITHTAVAACGNGGSGDVTVNNNEIDFFNALPGNEGPCSDVGRYTWTIKSGLLYFTSMSDPCRPALRIENGWSRTS